MRKLLLALCCAFCLSTATASANSLHDISDQLQRNVGCSAFEAFLITSAIAWGKEKYIDDNIDNNDAYTTMIGSLFYQVEF